MIMARTIWDDIVDLTVGTLAVVGAITIIRSLSNHQSRTNPQPRPYTVTDLRAETQAGFSLVDAKMEQLRNRVTALEKENARLRPFADFLENKEKETSVVTPPKPKLHLWR